MSSPPPSPDPEARKPAPAHADAVARDVVILIPSRDRETMLSRLLDDLSRHFQPALARGGLSSSIVVYAQHYARDALDRLTRRFGEAIAAGNLVIVEALRPHRRIGDVVHAAIEAAHARVAYRLAMLMDDDSLFLPDAAVEENLHRAAAAFIATKARANSIKLCTTSTLEMIPFVDPAGPIMPFKEKMMWASRAVLDEALRLPRFRELSIGEDAVIAALAWLKDPDACRGVFGIASFLHLGFEPAPDGEAGATAGGYAALMDYSERDGANAPHGKYDAAIRHGVTPYHIMPDIFVDEAHPHYVFNGVRAEVVARVMSARRG